MIGRGHTGSRRRFLRRHSFAIPLLAALTVSLSVASDARAVSYKILVIGEQDQTYSVTAPAGPCERVGQGSQQVLFVTEEVRANIVKGQQGYQFKTSKARSFAVNLPIHEAEISRLDETTRSPGPCDFDEQGNPVPLPPKDCRDDVSIANTMSSFSLFLGSRPSLEGGYFFLTDEGNEEPFANCLALARPDSFTLIGEGFYEKARAPKVPKNLLDRKKWKATGEGQELFDSGLEPLGTSFYTYGGQVYTEDIGRVGAERAAFESVTWTVYLRRARGKS
jgi:hypothetical protein